MTTPGGPVRADDDTKPRRGLAAWSEPVIADHLHDAYAERIGIEHGAIRTLVTAQGRFWRALLSNDIDGISRARRELAALARLSHIPVSLVDAVDVSVLDELMNVVINRFERSPAEAREHSHLLLRAAARLGRAHTVLV